MRAQKRRHYERKVWPQTPGTRQRKQKKDRYDPDEILRGRATNREEKMKEHGEEQKTIMTINEEEKDVRK